MNILVFSSGFPPLKGGIELFVYHICRQLAAQGHKVRVMAESVEEEENFDQHQEFQSGLQACTV